MHYLEVAHFIMKNLVVIKYSIFLLYCVINTAFIIEFYSGCIHNHCACMLYAFLFIIFNYILCIKKQITSYFSPNKITIFPWWLTHNFIALVDLSYEWSMDAMGITLTIIKAFVISDNFWIFFHTKNLFSPPHKQIWTLKT